MSMTTIIKLALVFTIFTATFIGQPPPEIQNMNNLPNAGQLYLDYCLLGKTPCIRVKAICYGQCCEQHEADSMGYGCSGDIQGYIPPLFRYAKWACVKFETGKVTTGIATPNYPTKGCTNPR